MSNVEPEEVEALLGAEGAENERTTDVRDFRRPLRLSSRQRTGLTNVLKDVLPNLRQHFESLLGGTVQVEVHSVGEVNAEVLFTEEEEFPCVQSFTVDGAEGWMVWECAQAVASVEGLLGVSGEEAQARELSEMERSVLLEILSPPVQMIAGALNAECSDFRIALSSGELQTAVARAVQLDAHRLEIELTLQQGETVSQIQLYLPGLQPEDSGTAPAEDVELSQTTHRVPVSFHARFAGCDVPLSQLLALEEGDVIPLEDRAADPIELFVGNVRYGTGRLGTTQGRLAVRIESTDLDA